MTGEHEKDSNECRPLNDCALCTMPKRMACDLLGLKATLFVYNQSCNEARHDLTAASSDEGSDGVRAK